MGRAAYHSRSLETSDQGRFKNLLDNVGLMAVMVDARARITYCNDSFSRLTGWTFSELSGRPWRDIFSAPSCPDPLIFVPELFDDTPNAWQVEDDLPTRSGERRLIRWNNIVLRDAIGRPVAAAGIGEDVTDHKQVERALLDCNARERCDLERELHDGLGQELAGIALLARSLATSAGRGNIEIAADLARLSTFASNAIESCRRIAREISPFSDVQGGLVQALRQLTLMASRRRGPSIEFVLCQTALLALSADASDHVYRIAQEWLASVIRHCAAKSIIVSLNVHLAKVRLEIVHDGSGARETKASAGMGFKMMQHRAALLAAQLSLEPRNPCGARLELVLGQPA